MKWRGTVPFGFLNLSTVNSWCSSLDKVCRRSQFLPVSLQIFYKATDSFSHCLASSSYLQSPYLPSIFLICLSWLLAALSKMPAQFLLFKDLTRPLSRFSNCSSFGDNYYEPGRFKGKTGSFSSFFWWVASGTAFSISLRASLELFRLALRPGPP